MKYQGPFYFFVVVALLSAGAGALIATTSLASGFVENASFWLCLAGLAYLVYLLPGALRDMFRQHGKGTLTVLLAVAVLLTVLMFLNLGTAYRVLADETNLLGNSLGFYADLKFRNVLEAVNYDGRHEVFRAVLPHRGPTFPFFLTLLHLVTGYAAANVFVLNFLAAVAGIFGIGLFVTHFTGSRLLGIILQCLMAAFPIYALCVTSAGFDAFNLTLLIWFFGMMGLLREEATEKRIFLTLVIGFFAMNCRYESAFLFIVFAIFIFQNSRILGNKYSLKYLPIAILPIGYFVQRLSRGTDGLQLNDGDSVFFSPAYGVRHFENLVRVLVNDGGTLPWPALLSLVAFLGLVLLPWISGKKIKAITSDAFVFTAAVALVQLNYCYGNIDAPYQIRYMLAWMPLFLFASATFGVLFIQCQQHFTGLFQLRYLVLAVCVGLSVLGVRAARFDTHVNSLSSPTLFANVMRAIEAKPRGFTLVVTNKPGWYASQGFSAITPQRFGENPSFWTNLKKSGRFDDILLVVPNFNKTEWDESLKPFNLATETLTGFRYRGGETVQLARLFPSH